MHFGDTEGPSCVDSVDSNTPRLSDGGSREREAGKGPSGVSGLRSSPGPHGTSGNSDGNLTPVCLVCKLGVPITVVREDRSVGSSAPRIEVDEWVPDEKTRRSGAGRAYASCLGLHVHITTSRLLRYTGSRNGLGWT